MLSCSSAHIVFFSILTPGFSFAFGNFAHYCVILLTPPLSGGEKKMSAMGYFLWEILIHCHWCQEVLSSHWLVSWCGARCQFTSHCELKSSIWFWEEYIHFEWIYKVFRFDPFSSNFGIMLQGCWQIKVCWEILMFEIFVPWHPFIQHASRLFLSYSNFRCQYLDNQSWSEYPKSVIPLETGWPLHTSSSVFGCFIKLMTP